MSAADVGTLPLTALCGGPADRPAVLLDDGTAISYRELDALVTALAERLARPRKALVFCRTARNLTGLLGYLAGLRVGHCVLPVEDASPRTVADLVTAYRPELVVDGTGDPLAPAGYSVSGHAVGDRVLRVATSTDDRPGTGIHPDTALLLRTSGSVGTPKTVRLTFANIEANARAIASALGITPADRAPTTLPLSHSYGHSVVSSHLAAGASIALTDRSPTNVRFWPWAAGAGCTGFYGVPFTYRLLRARRWQPDADGPLRSLHVAGGALEPEIVRYFAERMADVGGRMTVMYGQTEATARISCGVADRAADRFSVGRVVPGGSLWIESPDGTGRRLPDGAVGEVHYRGPNVMQGYATGRADLARGDERGGRLATGDLGYLRGGLLHLTGRRDRMVKLLGHRIDLDEVERAFGGVAREVAAVAPATATATGSGSGSGTLIVVGLVQARDDETVAAHRRAVADELHLPSSAIRTARLTALPRTAAGKVDYPALREILRERRFPRGGGT